MIGAPLVTILISVGDACKLTRQHHREVLWRDPNPRETVGVLFKINLVRQLLLGKLSFAVSATLTHHLHNLVLRYLHGPPYSVLAG